MFFELLNSKMRLAILFSLVLVPGLNSQSWQKVTGIDSIDVLSIVEHNNFLFSKSKYNTIVVMVYLKRSQTLSFV